MRVLIKDRSGSLFFMAGVEIFYSDDKHQLFVVGLEHYFSFAMSKPVADFLISKAFYDGVLDLTCWVPLSLFDDVGLDIEVSGDE